MYTRKAHKCRFQVVILFLQPLDGALTPYSTFSSRHPKIFHSMKETHQFMSGLILNVAKSLQSLKLLISCKATGSSTLHYLRNLPSTFTWDTGTKTRALTLSVAGLVELARPCSISGAANVETSSDRPQFLNAKVPVADSSKEVGLMILHILFWPEKKETFMYYRLYCSFTLKSHWGKQECTICLNSFIDFPLAQHDSMVVAL